MANIIRVLIAKPGLDGHDRGAKVVARALRDAGFEVIYTGLHQTPEMVVSSALQEDVDVIGLSILSGAHVPLVEAILSLMKKQKLDKPLFVGGIIPDDDAKLLKKKGVFEVFGPGSPLAEIAESVRSVALGGVKSSPKKSSPPKKIVRKKK
jgi:methylmalonyl-CoA mutase C-terminal domain/subunit